METSIREEITMIPAAKSLSPLQLKLKNILAAAQERKPQIKPTIHTTTLTPTTITPTIPTPATTQGTDRHGNLITYNAAQQQAIDLIASGQSCVVIGAAGTGKTTIQKASTQALIDGGKITPLAATHKYLKGQSPGVVICAFTRRATNNIRRNMSPDLQPCCITIHKTLEYAPNEVWITQDDGTTKRSMRFEPGRHRDNPLPPSISTIIVEEASMVSLELFNELNNASPHKPQWIFLGDIQQLPPVFGSAVLGYKMLELPVVELTEVHRQALDSPILKLAHRILSGKPIPHTEFTEWNVPGKLKFQPWKKRVSAYAATLTLSKFFIKALDEHKYNPETDAILIPYNKSCGSIELNKHIATRIAQRAGERVHEIIHGFHRSYYAVGDKCLYEREDAIIQSIEPNPQYTGATPKIASVHMNYWGHKSTPDREDVDDIDQLLATISAPSAEEDSTTRAASHILTLYLLDSERTIQIKTAGELNALILGYAITIHKAQGSEWDKVFLCLHHTHNMNIQRELLYTAVTRAKEELFVICESDTFIKGIERQRIPGNDWKTKAEHFRGKLDKGIVQS